MTHNAASETFVHAQTRACALPSLARLHPAVLGLRCRGGRGKSWVPTLPKKTPFEIVSRSPCPAGCANICSEWPKDWRERGVSTLLDLGSKVGRKHDFVSFDVFICVPSFMADREHENCNLEMSNEPGNNLVTACKVWF